MGKYRRKRGSSKGEFAIRKFLSERGIRYVKQKTFKTCKNVRLLRFDFYLPDFNLLIEYQGRQHFHPIKREKNWTEEMSIKELKKIQKNDNIKKTWCVNSGKKLITIKYNSKDIFKKIKKEID